MSNLVSFADLVSLLNSPPADVVTLTGFDRCVISRVNDRDIHPTVFRTALDQCQFERLIHSSSGHEVWPNVDRTTAALRLLSAHVFEELGSDHQPGEFELVLGMRGVASDPPRTNVPFALADE